MAQDHLLKASLIALVLLVAACGDTQDGSRPPATFASVTSLPPDFDPITTTTVSTTTTIAGAGGTAPSTTVVPPEGSVDALLAALVVEPEHSGAGYERELFDHWIDVDHNGCHTRCEVLNAERRTDLAGLASGWLSIYDGYTTDDPTELDVDHVVALAEAWRSGADTWDADRRRAFANDLDEPDALIAVTAATNRSKSDKDPARWQPPNRASWCQWATGWLKVKVKWSLSADEPEATALRNILRGC